MEQYKESGEKGMRKTGKMVMALVLAGVLTYGGTRTYIWASEDAQPDEIFTAEDSFLDSSGKNEEEKSVEPEEDFISEDVPEKISDETTNDDLSFENSMEYGTEEDDFEQKEDLVTGNGQIGNIVWELDAAGVLTLSGSGEMPHWENMSEVPWDEFRIRIVAVEISEGITTIGPYAFYGCENAADIVIPDSVVEIGSYAFSGCFNLTTVTVG